MPTPVITEAIVSSLVLFAFCNSAVCEPVTFSELAGFDITANIHRAQDIRRDGRSISMKVDQRWQISVNTDNTIATTVNTSFHTPQGTRKAPPNSGSFTLDDAREVRSRGGGKGAWAFADSTLTFTRTFPSGAFRVNLELSRNGDEIICTAKEAFAREGNKNIVVESPFGGEVTILSAKQLSSDCSIKRR
jgi:hypothetical protein